MFRCSFLNKRFLDQSYPPTLSLSAVVSLDTSCLLHLFFFLIFSFFPLVEGPGDRHRSITIRPKTPVLCVQSVGLLPLICAYTRPALYTALWQSCSSTGDPRLSLFKGFRNRTHTQTSRHTKTKQMTGWLRRLG